MTDPIEELLRSTNMVEELMDRMTCDWYHREEDGWHTLVIRDLDLAGFEERCAWCKDTFGPRYRRLLKPSGAWRAQKSKDLGFRNSAHEFRFREEAWAMFRLRWL